MYITYKTRFWRVVLPCGIFAIVNSIVRHLSVYCLLDLNLHECEVFCVTDFTILCIVYEYKKGRKEVIMYPVDGESQLTQVVLVL